MRKSIIASDERSAGAQTAEGKLWLNLPSIARVEMSSPEDTGYPVEQAFTGSASSSGGWRAAAPGAQTLRLHFDAPLLVKRILVHFREVEHERMQEFSLSATMNNGHSREIVRQQWSFSPGGSTEEQENYVVNLHDVVTLTLWIDPDRGQNRYPATLEAFRVEG